MLLRTHPNGGLWVLVLVTNQDGAVLAMFQVREQCRALFQLQQ